MGPSKNLHLGFNSVFTDLATRHLKNYADCAVEAPCTVKRTGSSRMRICPGLTDGEILPPTSFSASARLSSSASEPHTCAVSNGQVRCEPSVGPAMAAGSYTRLKEAAT